MNLFFKVFLIGWIILVGALFINAVITQLNIVSWYGFANAIQKEGFVSAWKNTSPFSLFFLFILYPLLLGLCGYVGYKLIL